MMNVDMNLPAMGLKDNDKNIYVFGKEIGVVSKGGENFYSNITIIDSKGLCFRLKGSRVKGSASLFVFAELPVSGTLRDDDLPCLRSKTVDVTKVC